MKSICVFFLCLVSVLSGGPTPQAFTNIQLTATPYESTPANIVDFVQMDSTGVFEKVTPSNLWNSISLTDAQTLKVDFLTDTFTDTNTTLLQLHFGENTTWQRLYGLGSGGTGASIYRSGNTSRVRAGSGASTQDFYGSSAYPRSANYSVTAVMQYLTLVDQYVAVCARMDHRGKNCYMFGMRPSSGEWQLKKMVAFSDDAPVITTLDTAAQTFVTGTDYTVKIVVNGPRIRGYVNGVAVVDALDSSVPYAGRPGITFLNASADATGTAITSITADDGSPAPVYTNDYALVIDGDSLSGDLQREGTDHLGTVMGRILKTNAVWNYSFSGRTVATMNSISSTQLTPHYATLGKYKHKVAVLLGGFNDFAGLTSSQVVALIKTWSDNQKATGYETLVMTWPQSQYFLSGADNTKYLEIQVGIRDLVGATYVADVAADPRQQDPTRTTFFLADQIHPTQEGERVNGELAANVMLWRNASPVTTPGTLAASATTLHVNGNVAVVTGDAGGNTLATITGGVDGMKLTLLFTDDKVTITDTAAATANTVNLSASFTSTANDTMTLLYANGKWFETARAVN